MKVLENVTIDSERFPTLTATPFAKDYFLAEVPMGDVRYLHLSDQKNGKVRIWITLALTADFHAISLPNAPFGGFWCEKGTDSTAISNFIDALCESLKSNGITHLRITQAPKPYESKSDLINYLLFKSKFELKQVLSHQFFCGEKKIKKFLELEGSKIRKKMRSAGLITKHSPISNFDFLKKIKTWNTTKGYHVSIHEDYLIQQVSSFPERYFLIELQKGEQVLGYALAVLLTSNSVYYYLSALDSSKASSGGGDFLLFELFSLAKERKVDFIDLGSSDHAEQANHSLMFFKARFSNEVANKMTWEKEF